MIIHQHAGLETYPYSPRLVRATSHCDSLLGPMSPASCVVGRLRSRPRSLHLQDLVVDSPPLSPVRGCLKGVQHRRLLLHTPASCRRCWHCAMQHRLSLRSHIVSMQLGIAPSLHRLFLPSRLAPSPHICSSDGSHSSTTRAQT